ncbi:CdaR family transcriptional regulator [Paenibacillus sp. YYML68]|uniref:PucR family transcriptional regulator n=1 Tax=Paenibacillus sp. YYML68 TaxID=2909250 RepID=UPI00248FFDD9|nr:helix-turn-helix domain-containing protein [Paenibacillus sp. YYML68]
MDWERLRQQVERIVGASVEEVRIPAASWPEMLQAGTGSNALIAERDGDIYFKTRADGDGLLLFKMSAEAITSRERLLVELMLDTRHKSEKSSAVSSSDESKAALLREWVKSQQELGAVHAELPDTLVSQLSLYSNKIPLLLYVDQTSSRRVKYAELKRLLESFFDTAITLVPLTDKEWLILGAEKILTAGLGDDKQEAEHETVEEQLAAIGYGLHDMLASEWIGECHLAVYYPILPAKSLYTAILQLRETILLGRTYNVGSNMHMPWELQLEKLVHLIPDSEKQSFLERVLKRLDFALDGETVTTLEYFFQLDCNVSETAKKLYIHRNTLLYRLDKFKQETGLDVRTFNHAVLVKLALLLYKVTKRS